VASAVLLGFFPRPAQALVKGNAPPTDMRKAKAGSKPKTANVDEAREMGRQKVGGLSPCVQFEGLCVSLLLLNALT